LVDLSPLALHDTQLSCTYFFDSFALDGRINLAMSSAKRRLDISRHRIAHMDRSLVYRNA
jgi:hypothetical protein